jgi:hypothetical protein
MEVELEAILIPLSFFLLVGFIVRWSQLRAEHETQRRFELGMKTLDRFSDPEALDKFLSSTAGQDFMRLLDHGEPPLQRRLLRSVQGGIALSAFGLSFLILSASGGDLQEMVIPGTMFTCLGVSLLVGAFVARKLALRWQMTDASHSHRPASPYRD